MKRIAEWVLRRHRLFTILALGLLVLLAWAWLAAGAGMVLVDSPMVPRGRGAAMGEMAMPTGPSEALVIFSMWLVMMVAMMLPSAAPTILLFARAAAHRAAPDALPPATTAFSSGYLTVWGAVSAVAAGLQIALQRLGLLLPGAMAVNNRWLSGGVLIAAGAYQLSPLKGACLDHCRSPAEFLARHYRPGARGAFRMGLIHGAYCFGCCWALMALLFVGGVMNLVWIAVLTLLVAAEKLLPGGRRISIVGGTAMVAAGGALILA